MSANINPFIYLKNNNQIVTPVERRTTGEQTPGIKFGELLAARSQETGTGSNLGAGNVQLREVIESYTAAPVNRPEQRDELHGLNLYTMI